jgi:hypothetical protein
MFCSFTVGLKKPGDASAPSKDDWRELYESKTSQWARGRERTPAMRGVGGARKHKWTPVEDYRLGTIVAAFGSSSWRLVAELLPGRSGKQCRERWLARMAPDVKSEVWNPQEDAILVAAQAQFGNKWARIREMLPGRSAVAVKNRWTWLCRRDIPNHSEEFTAIVMAQPEIQPKQGSDKQGRDLFDWEEQDEDVVPFLQ